jgi:hypothetical protein
MAASISDVRLPSDNGHQRDVPARPFRAKTGRERVQQVTWRLRTLLDHLVGAGEQRRRHV